MSDNPRDLFASLGGAFATPDHEHRKIGRDDRVEVISWPDRDGHVWAIDQFGQLLSLRAADLWFSRG